MLVSPFYHLFSAKVNRNLRSQTLKGRRRSSKQSRSSGHRDKTNTNANGATNDSLKRRIKRRARELFMSMINTNTKPRTLRNRSSRHRPNKLRTKRQSTPRSTVLVNTISANNLRSNVQSNTRRRLARRRRTRNTNPDKRRRHPMNIRRTRANSSSVLKGNDRFYARRRHPCGRLKGRNRAKRLTNLNRKVNYRKDGRCMRNNARREGRRTIRRMTTGKRPRITN